MNDDLVYLANFSYPSAMALLKKTIFHPKKSLLYFLKNQFFNLQEKISNTFPKNHRCLLECKHEITHATTLQRLKMRVFTYYNMKHLLQTYDNHSVCQHSKSFGIQFASIASYLVFQTTR